MNISVNPEDVNRMVSEAILKSALGEQLATSVDKAIEDLLSGYNSPVAQLVKIQFEAVTRQILLSEEWQTKIKEQILKNLTLDFVEKVFKVALQKAMREISDADR